MNIFLLSVILYLFVKRTCPFIIEARFLKDTEDESSRSRVKLSLSDLKDTTLDADVGVAGGIVVGFTIVGAAVVGFGLAEKHFASKRVLANHLTSAVILLLNYYWHTSE